MIRLDRDYQASTGKEASMSDGRRVKRALTAEEQDAAESRRRREKLLGLFRGRWHWAILLALGLGVAGSYIGYNSQGDEYEARSGLYIYSNEDISAVKDDPLRERYFSYVDGQIRKMESDEVISIAMGLPQWQEHLVTRPMDSEEIGVSAFAGSLSISPPAEDSNYLSIRFKSEHPETASAGLNALMLAYKKYNSDNVGIDLNRDLEAQRLRLRELENGEKRLQDEQALIMPESEAATLDTRLGQKLAEQNVRERELNALELNLAPFLTAQGEPTERLREEIRRTDPQMQALIQQKTQLENSLRFMLQVERKGEMHRDVQATRRALNVVDLDIAELEQAWADGDKAIALPQEILDQLIAKENLILAIAELDAAIQDMSINKSRLDRLHTQISDTREWIRETNEKISNLNALGDERIALNRTRIELGPLAPVPVTPANADKRVQMGMLGGVGGIVSGFGLVMLLGLMDRRLRHASDASLGMPDLNVLGILPTLPQNLKEPEEAETAAHCVHHIRTLLQIGGTNRVFSITSPMAGSGKSSLTSALGMSFASSGAKVLVIDCDLVGAGLSRRLGVVVHQPLEAVLSRQKMLDQETLDRALMLSTSQGRPLADVLLDQGMMTEEEIERAGRLQRDTSLGILESCTPGRLRSCVASTDMNGLHVLPVGKAKPADASKLSPTAIRAMIQQARELYDIVLIDTGPAMGSLEASIAAAEADATVLIVSRGDEKSVIRKCVELLESVHANLVGVVFNHALDSDMSHTSYASAISQDRRPDRATRKALVADLKRNARFGPLGSAVAAYQEEDSSDREDADLLDNPLDALHNGN